MEKCGAWGAVGHVECEMEKCGAWGAVGHVECEMEKCGAGETVCHVECEMEKCGARGAIGQVECDMENCRFKAAAKTMLMCGWWLLAGVAVGKIVGGCWRVLLWGTLWVVVGGSQDGCCSPPPGTATAAAARACVCVCVCVGWLARRPLLSSPVCAILSRDAGAPRVQNLPGSAPPPPAAACSSGRNARAACVRNFPGSAPAPPTTRALQVAMLIKLVCKIFWSCTYMEIPDVLLQDAQFVGWMQCLLAFATQPVPA
eukprot:352541-Chlamydomonas_euryale.AAC.5